MKNKHTPEPWHMRLSDNATPHIEHGDCYLDDVGELRNRICVMPAEISQSFNSFQNARRIVACVNACAGIPNEQLECDNVEFVRIFNELNMLKQQRDELQEEVNALKERAEYDLAEFARTLDVSYDEIKLLKKQRDELLALIKNDAFAMSFQSMGQYRTALIVSVKNYGFSAPARCIKPDCKTDCDQCSCAIPSADGVAMLVADLLEEIRDGHGNAYEDGEHPTVDRAREFLSSRAAIASVKGGAA